MVPSASGTQLKPFGAGPIRARPASDCLAAWQPPALGFWAAPTPVMQQPCSRQLHDRERHSEIAQRLPTHILGRSPENFDRPSKELLPPDAISRTTGLRVDH